MDVEGHRAMMLDVPPHAKKAQLMAGLQRTRHMTQRLKESEAFQMADDGKVSAVHLALVTEEAVFRATNSVRDRVFRNSAEVADDIMQRKTIPVLLASG